MTVSRRSHLAVVTALGFALAPSGPARAGDGPHGDGGGDRTSSVRSPRQSTDLGASLQELHAANLAVVRAAEQALQKASPAEMKEYAERVREEHRQLDFQLRETASQLGIELEGDTFARMHASAMNKTQALGRKSGATFERAFIEHVTEQHRRTAGVLDATKTSADRRDHPQLAAFLVGASQTVTAALNRARQLTNALAHGGADATSDPAPNAAQAHGTDELTGIVASVAPEERRILIAPDVGRSAELRIVPETRVTVNGRLATLQDIEPGAEVRVSYQQRENDPVAVTIDVRGDAAAAEYGREGARDR